jgi:hypothetical protein
VRCCDRAIDVANTPVREASTRDRLTTMTRAEYSPEAGMISLRINGHVYVLDKNDLALAGVVLLQLLADGRPC